jgi:hypothetical protein
MHEVKTDSYLVPSWAPEIVRPSITRELTVRMAAACCDGGNSLPDPRGSDRVFTEQRTYLEGEETPGEEIFYRAPPPDEAYCPGGEMYAPPDRDYYYYCSAGERCADPRVRHEGRRWAALVGWAPVLLSFGVIVLRRRRR